MPTSGLLIGIAFLTGQTLNPVIELTSSTTRPYVGQEITLTLGVDFDRGPTTTPLELTIPWLGREFGFHWSQPPADWLREQEQRREGVEVRLAGRDAIIRLEPIASKPGELQGRYRLLWNLVIAEPDPINRGMIVFAPVRLKTAGVEVVTKPLTLEVQKLPLRPADLPRLFLGVGDLHLEAELSAGEVDAGRELELRLRTRGGGTARQLDRPAVRDLWPATLQDRVRIEPGLERDEPDGRTFAYLLQPRRIGRLELPAIHYAVFDPKRGVYVTNQTRPLSLIVRRPMSDLPRAHLPYANVEVPERLRALHLDVSALEPRPAWPGYAVAIAFWILPPIVFLVLWLKRRQWYPDHWASPRQRWSAAAARAVGALRGRDAVAPEPVAAVLSAYLRERFGLEAVEPTPQEAIAALRKADLDGTLATRLGELLALVAAERFGPTPQTDTNLRDRVRRLIHELDAAS